MYFDPLYALMSGHPGGCTPGTSIRGHIAGFVDFCCQFLARDGGIGPLLHFRGKIRGRKDQRDLCFVAAILNMKDPDRGDWVLPLIGFQNGDGGKGKRVLRFSRKSVPFCWPSFPGPCVRISKAKAKQKKKKIICFNCKWLTGPKLRPRAFHFSRLEFFSWFQKIVNTITYKA